MNGNLDWPKILRMISVGELLFNEPVHSFALPSLLRRGNPLALDSCHLSILTFTPFLCYAILISGQFLSFVVNIGILFAVFPPCH